MIHAQMEKVLNLLTPQSFGSSATTSATVSVVGYNYATVILQLATGTNTDTTAQLSEGDTTSTFATATDLAMATAATDTTNTTLYGWHLDLRKRKKNLKIVYQPATGARVGSAIIILSRAEQAPGSTTAALSGTARGFSSYVVS